MQEAKVSNKSKNCIFVHFGTCIIHCEFLCKYFYEHKERNWFLIDICPTTFYNDVTWNLHFFSINNFLFHHFYLLITLVSIVIYMYSNDSNFWWHKPLHRNSSFLRSITHLPLCKPQCIWQGCRSRQRSGWNFSRIHNYWHTLGYYTHE